MFVSKSRICLDLVRGHFQSLGTMCGSGWSLRHKSQYDSPSTIVLQTFSDWVMSCTLANRAQKGGGAQVDVRRAGIVLLEVTEYTGFVACLMISREV